MRRGAVACAAGGEKRLTDRIDRTFGYVHTRYERVLRNSLNYRPVTYVFAALVFLCIPVLLTTSTNELAPPEDQGYILVFQNHAPNATLQQRLFYSKQVYEDFTKYP